MNSPQQARHGWPLLPTTTALVVCVAVAAGRTADSGDRPGSQPPVTADSLPASTPPPPDGVAQERTVEQRAQNEFLVRDRDYSVRLSAAERRATVEEASEAHAAPSFDSSVVSARSNDPRTMEAASRSAR